MRPASCRWLSPLRRRRESDGSRPGSNVRDRCCGGTGIIQWQRYQGSVQVQVPRPETRGSVGNIIGSTELDHQAIDPQCVTTSRESTGQESWPSVVGVPERATPCSLNAGTNWGRSSDCFVNLRYVPCGSQGLKYSLARECCGPKQKQHVKYSEKTGEDHD